MKLDEIQALASELDLGNILIKPEEVIFAMEDKGNLQTMFPVPNCERCMDKCCLARVGISLYDVVRFIDVGLDRFIAGTFSQRVDLSTSECDRENAKFTSPNMSGNDPDKKDCVFLNEEQKCSIYENRPLICQAYPIIVRIDENKRKVVDWVGGCKSYDLCDNESSFRSLVLSAIQYYNENVMSRSLLIYSRNHLRDIGLGKYLGFVAKRLDIHNKCNNGAD